MSSVEKIISRPENYKPQIQKLVKDESFKIIQDCLVELLSDEKNSINCRNFLKQLTEYYSAIKIENMQNLGQFIIEKFDNKLFYIYELYLTRKKMADNLVVQQSYLEAAKMLSENNYDQLTQLTDIQKIKDYLEIVQYYYEVDENIKTDFWMNKLNAYQWESAGSLDDKKKLVIPPELKQQYYYCISCTQDYQRKFLSAATSYYETAQLLQLEQSNADQNNIIHMYSSAVKCAILAPAGPKRNNILKIFYNNKFIQDLGGQIYNMLEKMYLKRIITEVEKAEFAKLLKSHQKAYLREGLTVYEDAIIQHNIEAASQIYDTISIQSLANILQLDITNTESIIQNMILEKRLQSQIDQNTNFITFLQQNQIIVDFNQRVGDFCNQINQFIEKKLKE